MNYTHTYTEFVFNVKQHRNEFMMIFSVFDDKQKVIDYNCVDLSLRNAQSIFRINTYTRYITVSRCSFRLLFTLTIRCPGYNTKYIIDYSAIFILYKQSLL